MTDQNLSEMVETHCVFPMAIRGERVVRLPRTLDGPEEAKKERGESVRS